MKKHKKKYVRDLPGVILTGLLGVVFISMAVLMPFCNFNICATVFGLFGFTLFGAIFIFLAWAGRFDKPHDPF